MDNGEETVVSLTYEKLYRYCFTCSMISHEERDCPQLSDQQRQLNRERRLTTSQAVDRRGTVVREADGRRDNAPRREIRTLEEGRGATSTRNQRSEDNSTREIRNRELLRDASNSRRQTRRNLYHSNEIERVGEQRHTVWQRIERDRPQSRPHGRESSIQSSSNYQKRKVEASIKSRRVSMMTENPILHQSRGSEAHRENFRNPQKEQPRRR